MLGPELLFGLLELGTEPSAGKSFGSSPISFADDTDGAPAKFVCDRCGGSEFDAPLVCCCEGGCCCCCCWSEFVD